MGTTIYCWLMIVTKDMMILRSALGFFGVQATSNVLIRILTFSNYHLVKFAHGSFRMFLTLLHGAVPWLAAVNLALATTTNASLSGR